MIFKGLRISVVPSLRAQSLFDSFTFALSMMVPFNRFFAAVYLAVVYASAVGAAPSPSYARYTTRRVRMIGRGLRVESFHPESSFETYPDGLEQPVALLGGLEGNALSFVASKLGLEEKDLTFKGGYESDVGKYAYVRQNLNGIPFVNAVANVAWKGNRVVSFGSSFVKPKRNAASEPTIDIKSAISAAEKNIGAKYNGHPTTLEYLLRPDQSAALVHVVQVQDDNKDIWVETYVDAHSGELLSVTDFVSHASYTVLPISKQILPEGQETLVDPQDVLASPRGWHATSTANYTNTQGNNVIAYKSSQSGTTVQSSADLKFNYTYDATLAPTGGQNVDAARVNAFYVANSVHDLTYRYGFTEKAFNFQDDNFGKGGAANDRVLISVQDSADTDNANFATPPDGQSGKCRMYLWTKSTPGRDGSMENDVLVHEMTHGLTNRLTGGGTGRCLQSTESRGLGEGWSDALAEWTEQKSANITDYVLGQYVFNKPAGLRSHPYSTNPQVNPLRYSTVKTLPEEHQIGEVWANLLHNVYAALVKKHGWSAEANTNPDGVEGNIVYLHLFIDALSIQPCNPTFVTARDAWIQADRNRYNGANTCTLWKAFASRGLGVGAKDYVDDETVPSECSTPGAN